MARPPTAKRSSSAGSVRSGHTVPRQVPTRPTASGAGRHQPSEGSGSSRRRGRDREQAVGGRRVGVDSGGPGRSGSSRSGSRVEPFGVDVLGGQDRPTRSSRWRRTAWGARDLPRNGRTGHRTPVRAAWRRAGRSRAVGVEPVGGGGRRARGPGRGAGSRQGPSRSGARVDVLDRVAGRDRAVRGRAGQGQRARRSSRSGARADMLGGSDRAGSRQGLTCSGPGPRPERSGVEPVGVDVVSG